MGLDIFLFVAMFAGGVYCWQKGFFYELSSKTGYLIGIVFAIILSKPIIDFLYDIISFDVNPLLLSFIVYFVLFLIGLVLTRFIGQALENLFSSLGIEIVDKILGFILGSFEMLIILAILVSILEKQKLFDFSGFFNNSFFYNNLIAFAKNIMRISIEGLKRYRRVS